MRCDEVRRLLLEADVEELHGGDTSPLSRHLQACPRCAEAADVILRANSELNAYLRAAADEGAVDRVGHRPPAAPSRFAPRWRASVWAPLAMAAAVTALILVAHPDPPTLPDPTTRVATAAEQPLVEQAAGSSVAVIQTDNPDITVLWFF